MAVSVAPSQKWEDGPWSSFALQIGSPPQTVRVFPSTSGSSVWAVMPEGCVEGVDPENCEDLRGGFYEPANSTSFIRQGDSFFQLPFEPEAALGFTGNAEVGFDNVTLGWPGSGGPTLEGQVIMGFATKDVLLGFLGLTPRPVNITDFTDQHESPLATLRNNKTIASSYWAYTAGAIYRTPPVYGSLTLGGYDGLRALDFQNNALTVPLGADTNRDLLVAINSISISDGSGIVSDINSVNGLPVIAYIDSTVPYMWLPEAVCDSFEDAFGLQWDSEATMYMINSTQHTKLVEQNATTQFELTAPGGGLTTNISFPYAAFDMELAGLEANETVKYFPLLRANDSTQYVLGRVFLQEAYVAADYDRSEFYVAQALFPAENTALDIVTVLPPGHSRGLSTGAIVGIVVGIVALLLAVAISTWLLLRRRRKRQQRFSKAMAAADAEVKKTHEEEQQRLKPELDATTTAVGQNTGRQELESNVGLRQNDKRDVKHLSELEDAVIHQVPGDSEAGELEAVSGMRPELSAESEVRAEMEASSKRPQEPVELP